MSKKVNLPVLVTRGIVIYPNFSESIEVGRKQSEDAIRAAIDNFDGQIIVTSQKQISDDNPSVENIYTTGTLAKVEISKNWKDGTLTVLLTGLQRIKLENISLNEKSFFIADAIILEPKTEFSEEYLTEAVELIKKLKLEIKQVSSEVESFISNPSSEKLDEIVDKLSTESPVFSTEQKAELITTIDPIQRLEYLLKIYGTKFVTSDVDNLIAKKLKEKMDNQQRDYYLREKMRAIKDELGEGEGADIDILEKYKARLDKEPFPKHVKEKILSSISKLEGMQSGSAEANVERNYIEWMMSLPWWEKTEDIEDLKHAKEVLDSHHYGLKKVKDRIIEYLAVKSKTKDLKGQIITLVGPPGVGKTSLAKSIAEAIGRNFVKISLGGVKDEAEIRGHRKTYVGAMPGRIIQTMKRAKVKNPLFLLDEIDKMASDQRGDPASAMLEVLDPEQNAEFSDHYIEEPYDLSNVMFIATANYPEDIPEALYDRMEIINLSSYTEIEKMKIAKDYLVPKVLKEHSLTNEEIEFKDEALDELIKYYTREAGVRSLERWISSVARKFIVKLLNKEVTNVVVDRKVINDYLGKRLVEHSDKQKVSEPGVVTGLAYTQFGGDILPIEVNYFQGKGGLTLTGKLGDVMKESATIALDFVKSNAEKYGINPDLFEKNDIHIHVPEGAVPKDGPSAGVTMVTAIVSALTNKPVSKEIGMTGEITLRGLVFPIGGLREKSIAASRSGLKKILIPMKNLKDLDEVPEEVKAVLEIKGIEHFDQTFSEVFGSNSELSK
ncbi:class III heat-shock ATP-dependent LonA protease [Williamsoniiplasma somnilux]|uniref:Lon protease n=1 Tax=Williamsoniiplasma somnilux TaxID=215578 RepID=A0A2K8NZ13_9MOLU|nr:endopeptidase La [Williamsoniiplasma somnilux]ATZ18796.1 class III heat-shock ATP-dependent LonA protease [Williamsoniiplasma somnilux]